jgi:type I restriction enzyme M protein
MTNPEHYRKTILDAFQTGAGRNIYCRFEDLTNEASVETFFLNRLIPDLGFRDSQIKTKTSITTLRVARGHKIENYKPDYVLLVNKLPRCVIDAKAPDEDLEKWVEQCSGYCLALNRKFPNENPVRYFALSNGKTTEVYEWDKDDPVLTLDFNDFEWGNPKLLQLEQLINPKSLVGNTQSNLLPTSTKDFVFIRPSPEKAKQIFASCHRAIWKSEGSGPAPAFMEFVKIMFVKMWADRNLRNNELCRDELRTGKQIMKLPSSAVTFSVDWIENREEEGARNPIDSVLFERLRTDIEREIQLRKKKRIFEKDERIKLRVDTLKDVVKRLEHYDLFGIDEDLNGRLFETFLSATMRGRELGQFFTPRSVVKMMTKLANLSVDRSHQDRVVDACCGTGGFLIEALTQLRAQVRANQSYSDAERDTLMDKVADGCIWGIDFGKDPPLARIARINMYLHGDGGSKIYFADALDKEASKPLADDPEVVQNLQELRENLSQIQFDFALTNPPFSMTKEAKNETEKKILQEYALAMRNPTSTEIRPSLRSSAMFIERYWEILKPKGKLLTVIDDTVLASKMFKFVRDFIRENFVIRAIISLPADTFRRSGSRVKTSVLLLEKKIGTEQQPPCFCFFSEKLGIDDLTPRASEDDVQVARTQAEKETEIIVNGYKSYLRGETNGCIISPERLADRLDLKFCFPQFGRMADKWRAQNVKVIELKSVMNPVYDSLNPKAHLETEFTLIKVTYDGKCEVDKKKLGKNIKAHMMYRVREGQLVFSKIRSTDGAVGIVPKEVEGALVSGSYVVFDCGSAEDTAYLWMVLRSHEIRADMQSLSLGAGRYTTSWPEVGAVLVPWLCDDERRAIGKALIESWKLEKEVRKTQEAAFSKLDFLQLESVDSVRRWKATKAPT